MQDDCCMAVVFGLSTVVVVLIFFLECVNFIALCVILSIILLIKECFRYECKNGKFVLHE